MDLNYDGGFTMITIVDTNKIYTYHMQYYNSTPPYLLYEYEIPFEINSRPVL